MAHRDQTPSLVVEHVMRARTPLSRFIARIQQPARLQRQATTADAAREPVAQTLEHADLMLDAWTPRGRQALPVVLVRRAVVGQRRQRVADLLQGQPDLLRHPDERDATDGLTSEAALAAFGARGADEPLCL